MTNSTQSILYFLDASDLLAKFYRYLFSGLGVKLYIQMNKQYFLINIMYISGYIYAIIGLYFVCIVTVSSTLPYNIEYYLQIKYSYPTGRSSYWIEEENIWSNTNEIRSIQISQRRKKDISNDWEFTRKNCGTWYVRKRARGPRWRYYGLVKRRRTLSKHYKQNQITLKF